MKDLLLFFTITLSVLLIGSLKESSVNQQQQNKTSQKESALIITANQ